MDNNLYFYVTKHHAAKINVVPEELTLHNKFEWAIKYKHDSVLKQRTRYINEQQSLSSPKCSQ
jgi:2-hydroxy-3-keto-5-methylthiopentenyl-1-phosphate phosphatase